MTDSGDSSTEARPQLTPGSRVAVRARFDGTVVDGFEIVGPKGEDGYRVRRHHDGVLLPAAFNESELVPESRLCAPW